MIHISYMYRKPKNAHLLIIITLITNENIYTINDPACVTFILFIVLHLNNFNCLCNFITILAFTNKVPFAKLFNNLHLVVIHMLPVFF